VVGRLEVALEKIMLTVVGLCFATMICVPLIINGVSQVSEQYAYSQFQDSVSTIDSGIEAIANGTLPGGFSKDVYIPNGVTMSSSMNQVTYSFDSSSMNRSIIKEYPLIVSLVFDYPEGWYSVRIYLQNSTTIVASFTPIGS
jgi:hypothetical protein